MSYTETVCWIGAQLADALAHAHAQGFIHNDLKPANVLLTDEGRPMLLDFGVAEEVALRATAPVARIGGTLPFMAPEHLAAIDSGKFESDHRSDLYGLGIILFEMLTGQHPFRLPTGETKAEVPKMLVERRAGPPSVRALNPEVSPGLEAIVRKCLEPDPARRYQSASDIREDLDLHRTHQPLRHVRVPCVRERLTKWARRNPRLSSNATLLAAALVVVGLMATGLYARNSRIERYEAADTARVLDDDLRGVRFHSERAPVGPAGSRGERRKCEAALARYGLPGDPAWERPGGVRTLSAEDQRGVRAQLTEACVLLARGYILKAKSGEADLLGPRAEWNALAERVAGGDVPRVVWDQRARSSGSSARRRRPTGPRTGPRRRRSRRRADYYLSGSEALANGRLKEARDLFARAVELDPRATSGRTPVWARPTRRWGSSRQRCRASTRRSRCNRIPRGATTTADSSPCS